MKHVGPDNLTDVERRILALVRDGASLADAALQLGSSYQWAKNHMQRAARRLDVAPGHGLTRRILLKFDGDLLDIKRMNKLTPVQRDIVSELIHARSYQQIAQRLGLGSQSVVRARVQVIFDKIGASSALELRSMLVIPVRS